MRCTLERSHLPFEEYGDGGLCHQKDLLCFIIDVVPDVQRNLMHLCFRLKSAII